MTRPGGYVRKTIEECAHCDRSDAPYVYMNDGQHYCVRCARKMLMVDGLRPAGRRADDLTLDEVLFRELPYSTDSRVEGDTAQADPA